MLGTPLQLVRTLKGTDFTAALNQGFGEAANLSGLANNQGSIENLTILSDQNLAWELAFFTTDGFTDADLDVDSYLGSIRFAEGDGLQIDGAGAYRYDVSGLSIPYLDADGTNELHCMLINRSAAAKNAGATGEVVAIVGFRPGTWV